MPEEPVKTSLGSVNAYLVEARSIGGLSGSPVFLHMPSLRFFQSGTGRVEPPPMKRTGPSFFLLGVMHGHFHIDPAGQYVATSDYVNMGIGTVTPATAIIETIEQPSLAEGRRRLTEKLNDQRLPVADSAMSQDGDEFDQFEQLARGVLAVPREEAEQHGDETTPSE